MSTRLAASVFAVTALLTACYHPHTNSAPSAYVRPTARGGGPPGSIHWNETVDHLGGQVGDSLQLTCAPLGPTEKPGGIWGSKVYTDDSSICTAAFHAGLITMEAGGTVTVEILPGHETYIGSMSNGIESRSYGPQERSFQFR